MSEQDSLRRLARIPWSAVLALNGQFLGSVATGVLGWNIWPTRPEWWAMGVLACVMGLASVTLFVRAIATMVRIHARQREIASLLARGQALRPAELAGGDALRRAGMTDD